jgi:ribonucleoside-diphosphate reductase alpha chain
MVSNLSPRLDRNSLLSDFGKKTLENQYLLPGESYQDLFIRVALTYGDNPSHSERMYDYISRHWFMPATPILANGGSNRGLPISCFLNEADDSLTGIVELWNENIWLASRGGGIGSYWGNLRSLGEKIRDNGETSGIVPFIKVMDSMTLAISQGSLRRGSAAVYLPISHPEIEEFIEIRKPTGGDHNRKALNLHHGIAIPDAFMEAVERDEEWELRSPKDGSVLRKISARGLWTRILLTRIETGEPYLLFIDHVNRGIPAHHKAQGLFVKTSNLCSEITLPTGEDPWGKKRTAVCCLSSLNLQTFQEWENEPLLIEDCMRFLDNVLEDFIHKAPQSMAKAVYAAQRERSVGLGVMGFHAFLQSKNVPLESVTAKTWNKRIFSLIKERADAASQKLAQERGSCPDAEALGIQERFSNKIAIAPTASISIICGGTSPGIEPFASNAYTHKTLSGSFPVRNQYLKKLLEERGKDLPEIWSSIVQQEGSVQHLDFLTPHEKAVFKTAFEVDQRWLVEHAGDRQPFICQAQSLNLFLPSNVHKRDLHQIHWLAWKKGVKSAYYLRSRSLQRAENTYTAQQKSPPLGNDQPTLPLNYEECLSCQ